MYNTPARWFGAQLKVADLVAAPMRMSFKPTNLPAVSQSAQNGSALASFASFACAIQRRVASGPLQLRHAEQTECADRTMRRRDDRKRPNDANEITYNWITIPPCAVAPVAPVAPFAPVAPVFGCVSVSVCVARRMWIGGVQRVGGRTCWGAPALAEIVCTAKRSGDQTMKTHHRLTAIAAVRAGMCTLYSELQQ